MSALRVEKHGLALEVDPDCGADIVGLWRTGGGHTAANLLAKRGIQTWIKTGTKKDPNTDALAYFYAASRAAAYELLAQDDAGISLAAECSGLSIRKTFSIVKPGELRIATTVTNASNRKLPLQIEAFCQLAGGRLREERWNNAFEVWGNGAPTAVVVPEPFGQRFVRNFPGRGYAAVFRNRYAGAQVRFTPADGEGLALIVQGNIMAVALMSEKFLLGPGASAEWRLGVEISDCRSGAPSLQAAARTASGAWTSLESLLTGEPAFEERWSHLCLQYDRTEPEDVRWIIETLLAPLKYNGIIFELDRGCRTASHPELAAPWALDVAQVAGLCDCARRAGLAVGIQFNSPGHQGETGMADAYLELLEPCGPTNSVVLCVSHPKARKIVGDVVTELAERLQPDLFHFGADEIQLDGLETAFGYCPRCAGRQPADLLADYLEWLLALPVSGARRGVWGDQFLQSDQFGPQDGGNGSAGGVWQAVARLPREVEIFDWHYFPSPTYASLDYFRDLGFRTWAVTAFDEAGMRAFLAYAQAHGFRRALHTTWAVPNQEKLPIESMVWAGLYHWLGEAAARLPLRDLALDVCRQFWKR